MMISVARISAARMRSAARMQCVSYSCRALRPRTPMSREQTLNDHVYNQKVSLPTLLELITEALEDLGRLVGLALKLYRVKGGDANFVRVEPLSVTYIWSNAASLFVFAESMICLRGMSSPTSIFRGRPPCSSVPIMYLAITSPSEDAKKRQRLTM
jgi:hypothetical protein